MHTCQFQLHTRFNQNTGNAIHHDQTNTFAYMEQDELSLNMNALLIAMRTPFFESSPIAGTDKHKQIAIKLGVKLFGK